MKEKSEERSKGKKACGKWRRRWKAEDKMEGGGGDLKWRRGKREKEMESGGGNGRRRREK